MAGGGGGGGGATVTLSYVCLSTHTCKNAPNSGGGRGRGASIDLRIHSAPSRRKTWKLSKVSADRRMKMSPLSHPAQRGNSHLLEGQIFMYASGDTKTQDKVV